jgi:hypothetical protein
MDFSPAVIDAMTRAHTSTRPGLVFRTMDVRALKYESESFDVIIDKGTFDCVVLSADKSVAVNEMLSELERVLRSDGGQLFLFSLYGPNTRMPYLTNSKYNWSVEYRAINASPYELPDEQHTHLYFITKNAIKAKSHVLTTTTSSPATTSVPTPAPAPARTESTDAATAKK